MPGRRTSADCARRRPTSTSTRATPLQRSPPAAEASGRPKGNTNAVTSHPCQRLGAPREENLGQIGIAAVPGDAGEIVEEALRRIAPELRACDVGFVAPSERSPEWLELVGGEA